MRVTRRTGVCICNNSKAERAKAFLRRLLVNTDAPGVIYKTVGKLCTIPAGDIRLGPARVQGRERDPQRAVAVNSDMHSTLLHMQIPAVF